MEQSVRIIRKEDGNVTYKQVFMDDAKIMGALAEMFIEYDDVTVRGEKDGHHFRIGEVINNIDQTELTDTEIRNGFYHAFAPSTIII